MRLMSRRIHHRHHASCVAARAQDLTLLHTKLPNDAGANFRGPPHKRWYPRSGIHPRPQKPGGNATRKQNRGRYSWWRSNPEPRRLAPPLCIESKRAADCTPIARGSAPKARATLNPRSKCNENTLPARASLATSLRPTTWACEARAEKASAPAQGVPCTQPQPLLTQPNPTMYASTEGSPSQISRNAPDTPALGTPTRSGHPANVQVGVGVVRRLEVLFSSNRRSPRSCHHTTSATACSPGLTPRPSQVSEVRGASGGPAWRARGGPSAGGGEGALEAPALTRAAGMMWAPRGVAIDGADGCWPQGGTGAHTRRARLLRGKRAAGGFPCGRTRWRRRRHGAKKGWHCSAGIVFPGPASKQPASNPWSPYVPSPFPTVHECCCHVLAQGCDPRGRLVEVLGRNTLVHELVHGRQLQRDESFDQSLPCGMGIELVHHCVKCMIAAHI